MKNKILYTIILILFLILVFVVFRGIIYKNTINIKNEDLYNLIEDENVIKIKEKEKLILKKTKISKTNDTTDLTKSNFKGLNAGILILGIADIKDIEITTDGKGANAIYSYGGDIEISNSKILTKQESSRGIYAVDGGKIVAKNLSIITNGRNSAAVATDRQNGEIEVINSNLETTGNSSPGIYSTGFIKVKKSTIRTNTSEIFVIDGDNKVELIDVETFAVKSNSILVHNTANKNKTATINIKDSLFDLEDYYFLECYNSNLNIKLENVKINSTKLFKIGNKSYFGNSNSKVILTTNNQELRGEILVENSSELELNLNNSKFIGNINKENNSSEIIINLKNSTLEMTDNIYISVLKECDLNSIISNGYNIYYDNKKEENNWLGNKIIELEGNGKIMPLGDK